MAVQIQIRRGSAADWTAANPTLLQGEPALETDTGKIKYGDGVTAWNSLPYYLEHTPAMFVQSSQPTMTKGDIWFDVSASV